MTLIRICLLATIMLGGILLDFTNGQDQPQTVAETSDYKSTSLSSEVVAFVDWCDEKAEHVTKHVFGKTVEGKDMVAAIIANPPYEIGADDERVRTLVIGNIHSGECAPKEALLMMIRELTHNPDHPWLENSVLVIAPNYNADGNDRIGKGNRPGQVGPENGMGMRENSQHLDLNRDFMKLESPEARSLVGLIDDVNPHMFIDGHTTNGSKHQYALTYDIPHNPAAPQQVRDYLWSKMMPTITQRLEKDAGIYTFYYGNFNRNMSAWTTYGHEPRYSTEYVGLRGRLSILSEAYAYLSYKDRIVASKDFISACIQYASENAETIKTLLDEVDREFIETASKQPERIQVSLNAKVTSYDEKFMAKGFKDGEPHDYEVDFVAKYTSTRSAPLPFAYVIPKRHARIADRLLMHGVQVQTISETIETKTDFHTIKDINQPQRAFQKHRMVTLETERNSADAELTQGDYLVTTAQPLGRLAAYLLEPNSDDGFTFWNFLDEDLTIGQRYPILILSELEKPIPAMPMEMVSGGATIDFAMIDGPGSLLANRPEKPRWYQATNQYVMSRWGRDYLVNAETGAFDGIVEGSQTPRGLDEKVSKALGDSATDELVDAIVGNRMMTSKSGKFHIYSGMQEQVLYDVENAEAIWLANSDSESELFQFSKDDDFLLFIVDKKMQFLNLKTRTIKPSSNPEIAGRSTGDHFGKLDWVYQEELYGRGNFKGFWYSEASDRLAILDLDEKAVQKYTVLDHIPTRGRSEVTAYPKAGDPIPNVSLKFENLNYHKMSGGIDGTLAYGELISNVNWSPDGNRLFVQVQNREQTTLDLIALDFDSPSVEANAIKKTTLIQEKTNGWIESYGTPEMFDDGSFLWLSARSGYTHLYHYEKDGKLRKQLTDGEWEIRSLIGVEPTGTYAFLTATKDDPLNVHGYRLEIETGDLQQITRGDGNHDLDFCGDYSYFIDTVSTFSTPEKSYICRADGARLREMESSSDDRLNYLDISKPEFMQIENADGHPMDAVIIRPPNFDPNKKYPVLYHIYAGPQAPRVRNRFQGKFYLWHQMMAQKGYVIWMCDNRSASFRGKNGMWETHRDLGRNELADITSSVDWLKEQKWVDADRIGIWGWSYGGYMTAYAMTHSKQFKMGISGAPVTDWKNYDAIYTERLMGLPQDNPKGYESSSVLNVADKLHGNLLLIHGTMDDNVHISNSMQFIYELQKANKQFDLMVYPKNRHAVRAEDQVGHLRRLMTKFVLENL